MKIETKKIRLLSISKNEHRSEYSFLREQKFFEMIRNLLLRLGFEKNDWVNGFGRPWDEETEKPILKKENDILSKDYDEQIITFSNYNYSIDIIFFSKKIFVIFNYKKDMQQEISKALDSFVLD